MQALHWLKAARAAEAEGHEHQAILNAEEGLVHAPDHAELHHYLAALYRKEGLNTRARKHFAAARAFAPDHSLFTLDLIDDYLRTGEAAEAMIYLGECLQKSDLFGAPALFLRLGRALFINGQWNDALRAFLQVLAEPEVSQEEAASTLLYALEIMLRRGLYLEAQGVLHDMVPSTGSFFHWIWEQRQAQLSYWQGDFGQARAFWRNNLEQRFDEAVFGALQLLTPPVAQSQSAQKKWETLIEETGDLFRERPLLTTPQSLFNPFDYRVGYTAREKQRLDALGVWYHQHFASSRPKTKSSLDEVSRKPHIAVITDEFTPDFCCFISPWLHHYTQAYATGSAPYDLTIFYFSADGIPPDLTPFEALFYQLPVHVERAQTLLKYIQPDIVLYTQLKTELYRLALTPSADTQNYLYPLAQYYSGIPSLRSDLVEQLTAQALDLSEPLSIYLKRKNTSLAPFKRSDYQLPSLGNLYFFALTPLSWTPEFDALASAILKADRKAFLVGLKISGSALHTHAQQRHEETLAKPHRVRWLDLTLEACTGLIQEVQVVIGGIDSERWLRETVYQQKNAVYYTASLAQETPLMQWLKNRGGMVTNELELACNMALAGSGAAGEHVKLETVPGPSDLQAWESILLSLED